MKRGLSEHIYQLIIREEQACVHKGLAEKASQVVAGNFIKIIAAQFLTKVGDAVVNPKVTLPWIMQSFGAAPALVAWLVPIREAGSLLPQLFIANYLRRLALRKWVWICGSVLQALFIAATGVVTLFASGSLAAWGLLGFLALFSLSRGLNSVTSKDILGKTIPKNQRGQVNGWSASGAGLVTMVLALLMGASLLWDWQVTRSFYGWCLIGGASVWLLAALVYMRIIEFPGETDSTGHGIMPALRQLALLKTDAALRHFVCTRTLFLSTALSAPFYIVLAQQSQGEKLWVLALFMLASGVASFVSGPFWGRFADRSSRVVMMTGAGMSAAIGLILFVVYLFAPALYQQVWWLPGLYFCVCIAHDGVRVGRKTYLVDLATGNKRTSYVAVSNTVIGVMLLVMSLFGLLTSIISIAGVVAVFAMLSLGGIALASALPEVSH